MPKRPDKFGIKFWLLVEVKNKYICNGFPYLEKCDTRNPNESVGEYVGETLMEPFEGNRHCVVMDNFFTTPYIASYLLHINSTCVGTVRKDKRSIPNFSNISLKLGESRFYENIKGVILQYF